MEVGDLGFVGLRTGAEQDIGVLDAGVEANEVWHAQDAGHPAGVIAEEDAAKGRKGAHQVRLHRDGSLDPAGVGRAGDNHATRHVDGRLIAHWRETKGRFAARRGRTL